MSGFDETARRGSFVLALLLIAYIFNFLDRQILGILGPAIQADLHLSNAQFGAIGGTAFALLYAGLANSACLSRGPDQPERCCCGISCSVERIHGALRRFDRLLVVVRFSTRCRRGRSRRSGSLLRFDRRLFPARTSRSRTRHFFTRNPARIRKRSDHRCSPRRLVRLANRFCHHGCWRAGARPDPPRPRA